MNNIILDKEYTYKYRDIYNEQCSCESCVVFQEHFAKTYPNVVEFLKQFGVNTQYPIEVMDFGIECKSLKRKYIAYYAVKGCLPQPKMTENIDDVFVVMRNNKIASESYSNTNMEVPFFIIELNNILLQDNQAVFIGAINTGREIEFRYLNYNYFLSRNENNNWYVYCEENKSMQTFTTIDEILNNATLQGEKITGVWDEIIVDFLL